MSTRRIDYGTTFEIFAGTKKTFQITVEDPATGLGKDLTSTATYASGNVKIQKPDGTLIGTLAVTYVTRASGIIQFTVTTTEATNDNAGNWIGNMELINNNSDVVEQQFFNFNILENY